MDEINKVKYRHGFRNYEWETVIGLDFNINRDEFVVDPIDLVSFSKRISRSVMRDNGIPVFDDVEINKVGLFDGVWINFRDVSDEVKLNEMPDRFASEYDIWKCFDIGGDIHLSCIVFSLSEHLKDACFRDSIKDSVYYSFMLSRAVRNLTDKAYKYRGSSALDHISTARKVREGGREGGKLAAGGRKEKSAKKKAHAIEMARAALDKKNITTLAVLLTEIHDLWDKIEHGSVSDSALKGYLLGALKWPRNNEPPSWTRPLE